MVSTIVNDGPFQEQVNTNELKKELPYVMNGKLILQVSMLRHSWALSNLAIA